MRASFEAQIFESIRYSELDQLQRLIAARIRDEDAPGELLIAQTAPVITLGRREGALGCLRLPPEAYTAQGIEVLATDRGGLATYHGPGQWVVFAVEKLERLFGDSRAIKSAVGRHLDGLKAALADAGIATRVGEDKELGLWSRDRRKLASVGVAVKDGILLHGVSLNIFATPQSFYGLDPCGLVCQMGYVSDEPLKSAQMMRWAKNLEAQYLRNFWLLDRPPARRYSLGQIHSVGS